MACMQAMIVRSIGREEPIISQASVYYVVCSPVLMGEPPKFVILTTACGVTQLGGEASAGEH